MTAFVPTFVVPVGRTIIASDYMGAMESWGVHVINYSKKRVKLCTVVIPLYFTI